MELKTKQQKRADLALSQLKEKVSKNDVSKELANFIVGMPNMILSNGLGQSMAFLKAKSSKKEREFVFNVIKTYLQNEYKSTFTSNDDFEFLKKLNTVSQTEYVKMQEEVLRILEWLKRYARAFQKED